MILLSLWTTAKSFHFLILSFLFLLILPSLPSLSPVFLLQPWDILFVFWYAQENIQLFPNFEEFAANFYWKYFRIFEDLDCKIKIFSCQQFLKVNATKHEKVLGIMEHKPFISYIQKTVIGCRYWTLSTPTVYQWIKFWDTTSIQSQ